MNRKLHDYTIMEENDDLSYWRYSCERGACIDSITHFIGALVMIGVCAVILPSFIEYNMDQTWKAFFAIVVVLFINIQILFVALSINMVLATQDPDAQYAVKTANRWIIGQLVLIMVTIIAIVNAEWILSYPLNVKAQWILDLRSTLSQPTIVIGKWIFLVIVSSARLYLIYTAHKFTKELEKVTGDSSEDIEMMDIAECADE